MPINELNKLVDRNEKLIFSNLVNNHKAPSIGMILSNSKLFGVYVFLAAMIFFAYIMHYTKSEYEHTALLIDPLTLRAILTLGGVIVFLLSKRNSKID